MNDLLDGCGVHQAAEEQRRIVATRAPFRRLVADRIRSMYSIDLRYHWLLNEEKWCAELNHWVVDIFVAALTRKSDSAMKRTCWESSVCRKPTGSGTGKERPFGSVVFAIHVTGRHRCGFSMRERVCHLSRI